MHSHRRQIYLHVFDDDDHDDDDDHHDDDHDDDDDDDDDGDDDDGDGDGDDGDYCLELPFVYLTSICIEMFLVCCSQM